jgi:hypothetical protein
LRGKYRSGTGIVFVVSSPPAIRAQLVRCATICGAFIFPQRGVVSGASRSNLSSSARRVCSFHIDFGIIAVRPEF